MGANTATAPATAAELVMVHVDESGRARLVNYSDPRHPVATLHARTWAQGVSPSDDDIREAYAAAGFPAAQLERSFRRKERWRRLPEVACVRFPKAIGAILRQSELLLPLTEK